jgi:agmatine deiminase
MALMPAETDPHERTLMVWPARRSLWGDFFEQAEHDYAEIATAIHRFEPVTMVAPPGAGERAQQLCGPDIDVIELPVDDSWARDSGPTYVLGDPDSPNGRTAVDWMFNSWGEKYLPYDEDDRLPERWADHEGDHRVRVPMVLEGGSLVVDGEGTLVTTEQCLLHPNRNPDLTRAQIEAALGHHLGATEVVWIPNGLFDDEGTDGHVDNIAAFARPGRVVMQGCDDPARPDHHRMAVARRCVAGHPDAAGQPLQVVEIPVLPFVEIGGQERPVPYVNLYVCNGGVIVPTTGHPADADMLALLGEQYPGRQVVAVPGMVLTHGGGGVHCITQQIPALPGAEAPA